MLYLLYGPDNYRLKQKLSEIVELYSLEHGSSLDITNLNLQEENERSFWDIFNQTNLFVSKKLLVVENIFSSPVLKKEVLNKIRNLAQSPNILIFIENKEIKPSDSLFLAMKENGKVQEFLILIGMKLKNWVKESFKELGSVADEAAIEKLLGYTNGNTWALSNEIKKLSAFTKSITSKEVELLVKPKFEVEIFKTIEAFFASNKKTALAELQKHLDLGESPVYLLLMLAYQIRNLLMVKLAAGQNALTSGSLGMRPFVFQKSANIAKSFSLEKLKNIFHSIFLSEIQIKTGQNSPENAFRQLLIQI